MNNKRIEVKVFEQYGGSKSGHGQWRTMSDSEILPLNPDMSFEDFTYEWDMIIFSAKRGSFYRISDGESYTFMGYPEENNIESISDPYHYLYIKKTLKTDKLKKLGMILMDYECLSPNKIIDGYTYVATWMNHQAYNYDNLSGFLFEIGLEIVIRNGLWYIQELSV